MQANELRLGNWVDYFGKYYKLDSVTEKGTWINIDSGTSGVFWCEINPIYLTEDILLKCGFEYRIHQYTYKELSVKLSEEYFLVFNMKNGNIYTTNNEERELHSGMYLYDINYLHQLQNLYFALTNQELNIEL